MGTTACAALRAVLIVCGAWVKDGLYRRGLHFGNGATGRGGPAREAVCAAALVHGARAASAWSTIIALPEGGLDSTDEL